MAKMQRDKGQRRERELVHKHLDIGIKSERVSDSGASGYRGFKHDIDVYAFGEDEAPLIGEVKARKNGAGFKVIDNWLGENDFLALKQDRQDWVMVVPWRVWEYLMFRTKP